MKSSEQNWQIQKKRYFKLSLLTLAIISQPVFADSELDFSFLQGQNTQIPDVLRLSSGNVPGQYLADVFFNGKKYTRKVLVVTEQDKTQLCLNAKWLKDTKLPINYDRMLQALNSSRECYDFSKINGGSANFDYGRQRLSLHLPQLAILEDREQQQWDYGTPGFHLNYAINGSKSFGYNSTDDFESFYGNLNFNANYDRWVLSAKTSGMSSNGFSSPDVTISTALKPIRGDLIIGKSITRTSMFPDFSFYGVAIRSNSSMVPWSARGYAPVINGVLNTNALVTVKQGDYILYSKNLPAGPYALTDLSPVSNGDITVLVEEDNGAKSTRVYPVTTLPTLLREDDFNYNFATGIREYDSGIDGIFGLASLDYGLDFGTANFASILHQDYQSIGSGLTLPIGDLGAISASVNMAWSHYKSAAFQPMGNSTQQGISATLQYAKDFGKDTNLQLLTYRYTGDGYTDFSDFKPNNVHTDSEKRSRYEAVITQKLGLANLNISAWAQDYRNGKGSDVGANASLSGVIGNGISLGLSGSYTDSDILGSQYSTSFSINVPLNLWERTQFTTNSLNYDSLYGTSFNTGMSFSSSDDISHNVNINIGKNQRTASLYTGVRFDAAQTGFSVSQSENSTALSASMSGSIAGAKGVGFAYSHQQNNTIAIANIDGIDDVKFNDSIPTNSWGNTLVPLSSYQSNDITIDTNNIPENIELLDSNFKVVPTENSIIVRKFNYVKVNRYLLRVLDKQGRPLPMGTQVKNGDGVDVGFIASGGVLIATLLSPSDYLEVFNGSNQCHIDISKVKSGSNQVTDIRCLSNK